METCVKAVLRSVGRRIPHVCKLVTAKSCYADRTTTIEMFTDVPVLPHYRFVLTYIRTLLSTENIKVLKH